MQEAHSSEPDRSRGLVLRNAAGHEILVLTWAQYLELARPSELDRVREQLAGEQRRYCALERTSPCHLRDCCRAPREQVAHDGLPVPLRVAAGRARRRSPWGG
jgi:hypothetical protein